MGQPHMDWSGFSDRALLDIHRKEGSYEAGAAYMSKILGRVIPRSTYYDEMKRRNLTEKTYFPAPAGEKMYPPPATTNQASWSQEWGYFGGMDTTRPVDIPPAMPPTPWPVEATRPINFLPEEPSADEALEERCKQLETQVARYQKQDRLDQRIINKIAKKFSPESFNMTVRNPEFLDPQETRDEYVLLLSDAHYSEVVLPSETSGMEEYNPGIHDDRMVRLFNQIAARQNSAKQPIKRLNVFYLGDMLSGNIHEELESTNAMPASEGTYEYTRHQVEWHRMLEYYFEEQFITGVSGNHPRFHKKTRNKNGWDGCDWISYSNLALVLSSAPGYHFDIPKSNHHDVLLPGGWRALLFHGQGVKSYGASGPEGAVIKRVKELQDQYQNASRPIDYVMLGHWHRASALSITGAKVFINGSIKGIDEYGLNNFGAGTQSEQLLLTVNPECGITDVSYLALEPRVPQRVKSLI